MTFPLPVGEYTWVTPEECQQVLNNPNIKDFENIGYFLEVDLECPPELHDFFSRYPLFPEHLNGKLIATLYPKKNYKVHIAYLKWAISKGYQVTKIHRVIRFRQAPIFKSYIEHLVDERKKYPKGTFLNEFYKILANSLFVKCCEDQRNIVNLNLLLVKTRLLGS
jgi:hypothetical protein